MPTAGEARLKSKPVKTVKNGAAFQTKKGAVAAKRKGRNLAESKQNTVKDSDYEGKSLIPVSVKKRNKGKENKEPNAVQPVTTGTKTSRVKQAPDFSKLHEKWQDKLAKGKAVSKKKNTVVEPFQLSEQKLHNHKVMSKRRYAYNSEDEAENDSSDEEDEFEIDSAALKAILNNTGIAREEMRTNNRATIATIPSSSSVVPNISCPATNISKRTSIYCSANPTHNSVSLTRFIRKLPCTPASSQAPVGVLKSRNVEVGAAAQTPAGHGVKKQLAWADQVTENDEFDFQPDSQALRSILNNTGITQSNGLFGRTGRVTLAGGKVLTPRGRDLQSYREENTKRTSIYYAGPKRTRSSPSRCRQGMSVLELAVKTTTKAVGVQRSQQEEVESSVLSSAGSFINPAPTCTAQSLCTPARQPVVCTQAVSSKEPSFWSEMFTPQRGNTQKSPIVPVSSSVIKSTPAGLPLFPSQASYSKRNCGLSRVIKDLDTRQNSNISAFGTQPSSNQAAFEAQSSFKEQPCWADILNPCQNSRMQVGNNTSPVKKENELAELERQALEGLRLLQIFGRSPEEVTASSSNRRNLATSGSAMTHSFRSNTATTQSNNNLLQGDLITTLPGSQIPGFGHLFRAQNVSDVSQNINFTSGVFPSMFAETYSRFAPPVILATPTPVKKSRTDVYDTLHGNLSLQGNTPVSITTPFGNNPEPTDDIRLAVGGSSGQTSPRTGYFRAVTPLNRKVHTSEEVMLDMEVSMYTARSPGNWKQRLVNPLAQMFTDGKYMHFVPISE